MSSISHKKLGFTDYPAYYAAYAGLTDNVVLLAPGIALRLFVGEQNIAELKFNQITVASLNSEIYENSKNNPHINPIRPNSPLLVPNFAIDLIGTSKSVKGFKGFFGWKINKSVKGLVLLSGENDTYVNSSLTKQIVSKNAKSFVIKSYQNALQELDNEKAPIRNKVHEDVLSFLLGK